MIDIKYNAKLFEKQLEILDFYNKKLPFTYNEDKLRSNIISEIHNSLITEGEFSSRREIKTAFKSMDKDEVSLEHYKNYIHGYRYVTGNKNITKNDIFGLYSILTKNIDLGKETLDEGSMFRKGDVVIGSKGYNDSAYYGADPKEIMNELDSMIDYIKSDKEPSIILKCIVSHFIFESIHPFYDYNGRTGRLLPIWIMSLENKYHTSLRYFSTSVGTFREKYLKAFTNSNKKQTSKDKYKRNQDINYFIKKILNLLILNQYQYDFINDVELTSNEKLLVLSLLRKYEIQNSNNSWIKSNQLLVEIDPGMKQPQFSKLIDTLVKKGVIEKLDSKPMKIKLIKDYTLFKDSDIYKKLA